MRWRNQQLYPLLREIGGPTDADLCTVGKNGWLALSPVNVPNSLPALKTGECNMIVSLQARSAEVDSSIYRFQIAWDGCWVEGETEMKRHLLITDVSDKPT
jgi:hypothetical protein